MLKKAVFPGKYTQGVGAIGELPALEEVGLPTTLADIGLGEADRGRLMMAAEKACAPDQPVHHEAGAITPRRVLDAMLAADALGLQRKVSLPR
jgi:glycerol dehydrogenase-like iron-containing ADH family enzyme